MLYVYKASAGSGKTHLLTGFYIELLFRRELTPCLSEADGEGRDMHFSEILAVTFTNKATAEMKQRIIDEIYHLSVDPRTSLYYDSIAVADSRGHVPSDDEIRKRANDILRGMLTDYTRVHISTIDSFFQQVIRSFAHEMNLQGNYEVELDANAVLDHAVSEFLLGIDPKTDKETFNWLLDFANSRLSEGSGWNVHQELFRLSKQLISESYRNFAEQVAVFTADKQQMREYVQMLREISRTWKNELKRLGNEGLLLLDRMNVRADEFSGNGKGATAYFAKYASGESEELKSTLIKWSNNPDAWFKKNDPHHQLLSQADKDELQQLMQKLVAHLSPEGMRDYLSARFIAKNFYQLGLLSRLREAADRYCKEQGIKLLSDTTQLLNDLVVEQESPFIYEKTGTRILSYMIDEFQDTSSVQWNNFKPLLVNSLGTDCRNLIVGDVKQSIYRWRGSDWELLDSVLPHFMPELQAKDKNNNELRDNWRSDKRIIAFNNAFFRQASQVLSALDPDNPSMQKIARIYGDVEQTIAPEREKNKPVAEGLLHYEQLIPEEGENYRSAVQRRLPELVIALQQKGYQPGQILILCRKGDQCKACAEALLSYKKQHPDTRYGFEILTSEALKLSSRQVIRALIAFLQYIREPKSDYRKTIAGCHYLALEGRPMHDAISAWFGGIGLPFDLLEVQHLPLYEMVEQLIALLPASCKDDAGYLQAFRDNVLEFSTRQSPSLDAFLHWWDEKADSLSITTPAGQNAIRIMTIHQSKGLGEDAVIVPFAQGSMDIDTSHGELLWCEPKVAPFARQGLVLPIALDNKLSDTIFSHDFAEERLRAIIDNLNTVYVAFTRAKHALVILSPKPAAKATKVTQEALLSDYFGGNQQELTLNEEEEPKGQNTAGTATVTSSLSESLFAEDRQPNNRPVIKESNEPQTAAIAKGVVFHDALSAILDSSNIEEPVRRLFASGRADAQGISVDDIIAHIRQLLADPKIANWFAPGNLVLNERNIITHTTHTQRPDRMVFTPTGQVIIIDYKTGEELPGRHSRQVLYYKQLIQQMGFNDVKAYLWYIEENRIVEPQPKN
ncbi:MAG: UvrD-helicase domain-containing protein [Bacteroidales bacterium]|nr:UvrD-helicase domain-containing protein [Bacteroidales bacterium]